MVSVKISLSRSRTKPFNECVKTQRLGYSFNRQHRPTHHSTVTALQGCLRYPHYRSLSLQSCPHCIPWCSLTFLSFLTTFQYMMAGIHFDVQLCDSVCIFLKEVWQARSAWNILDCLILLLLLRKKILEVFRACGRGSSERTNEGQKRQMIFVQAEGDDCIIKIYQGTKIWKN